MSDNNTLLEKVEGLKVRLAEIQKQLSDPESMADMKKYVQLNKDYKELEPIVKAGEKYKKMLEDYDSAKDLIVNEKDEELKEMAREEMASLEEGLPKMEEEIKLLLIPADPEDGKNAIMEIRGGTGGDEAAIFAGDLFRMYSKYIEKKGWKLEVTRKSSAPFPEMVYTGFSNMNPACTASSVCLRPRLREGFTHPPLQWWFCRKPESLTWR